MMNTRSRHASVKASDLCHQGVRSAHALDQWINGLTAVMRSACFALVSTLLAGCASPAERADVVAERAGLSTVALVGGGFSLKGFERQTSGRHATVFIEGDGRPWRAGGRVIAEDPTPLRLLALSWMEKTPGPTLYLGRPCYFQSKADQPCDAMLWSYGRYSEQVVQSMVEALGGWLQKRPHISSLTLVGHSGGGVLALLLAERVPHTKEVIALSTPVDVDAWTSLHAYTPLFTSLNPVNQPGWRAGVQRSFYFGEADHQVPPSQFVSPARAISDAEVTVVKGVGHDCCGPDIWLKNAY